MGSCKLEIPAARFGEKPPRPDPQNPEFEKAALFSVSLDIGRHRSKLEFIDRSSLVSELKLSDDEIEQLNNVFKKDREQVLETLASYSRIEAPDAQSARLTVTVPQDKAAELRREFYADLTTVLRVDRLTRMGEIQNMAQLEASFEFFGEFPIVYEFEGKGASLADATIVNTRTTVLKKDAHGTYDAYWEGLYPAAAFSSKFGKLAAVATQENKSSK